jgi:hypothetical protein
LRALDVPVVSFFRRIGCVQNFCDAEPPVSYAHI